MTNVLVKKMELYRFKPYAFLPVRPWGNMKDGPSPPMARSGHRIVCLGSNIYSFGGYNPTATTEQYPDEAWQRTHPLFQELWKFNIPSSTWSRLVGTEGMPDELASHSAVQIGPNMLVYGGTAMPFGDSSSNSIYSCHLPTGKWSKIHTKGTLPTPMYGQAVCLSDSKFYCVGGTTGFEYSIDVHCLDLATLSWEYLPVNQNYIPQRRYRHEIVEHNGSILVLGGGRSDAACCLARLPTFLINECRWILTQTHPDPSTGLIPNPRRCHVAVKFNEYVYIHGGYDGSEAYADLWRLNLNTFEWHKLPYKSPVSLYFHSAAVTESGCMYIFGGVKNLVSNVRTDRITKVWLGVGKLRDISWEALCHYAPHLPSLPSATLLQMGIPLYIVDTLHHQTPAYG